LFSAYQKNKLQPDIKNGSYLHKISQVYGFLKFKTSDIIYLKWL
jgi:hypothetical protein